MMSLWKSNTSESTLFANVPPVVIDSIKSTMDTYLPLCTDDKRGWKTLFDKEEPRSYKAYQRFDDYGRSVIKSVALLDHPPKQIFNLLIDISKRKELESNVNLDERLKVLNPHTFLDYYNYKAVWPTAAREFAVVNHWQVVQHGDENASLIVNFSSPEADSLKKTSKNHVRGNLLISMYLLRPVGTSQCHLTRLLSFDLNGQIPRKMANTITSQQAGLPNEISAYLKRHEPVGADRLRGDVSDEALVRDVIRQLTSQS